jgi:hypothetical protein
MSITARCRCGKKYQLKAAAAGKKFRCKECESTVQVPDEQLDDLEDAADYEEDEEEELRVPVRRSKKPRRRSQSYNGPDFDQVLRVFGIVTGIIGYISSVLCFLGGLVYGFLLIVVLSARHNAEAIAILFGLGLVQFVFGVIYWIAARAACGGTNAGSDANALRTRIIIGCSVIWIPTLAGMAYGIWLAANW